MKMFKSTSNHLNYHYHLRKGQQEGKVNGRKRRLLSISLSGGSHMKESRFTMKRSNKLRIPQTSQSFIIEKVSLYFIIVIAFPQLALPVTNAQQRQQQAPLSTPLTTIPQRPLLIRRTNTYPNVIQFSPAQQTEFDFDSSSALLLKHQQLPPSLARSSYGPAADLATNELPKRLRSPKRDFLGDIIIPPYENYDMDSRRLDQEVSYVIDKKRFIEAFPSRCMSTTLLEDPYFFEPGFALIRPTSEVRLNATCPTDFIRRAGFEPNKRTTIIVHGFTQSYPDTVWLRRTRALFETNAVVGRQNLIIMDYGTAASQSYAQVAALASAMGSYLANFLMKLYQLGANPMSIHIVGHSLGAHVAGFAGKRLRPKIGRITALDAAGPCFGKIMSNNPHDRLQADDAYEVDVYHYDDDFLGLPGQNGQFDVYVNGGASQPGCTGNVNSMFQAMVTMVFRRKRVLSESHTRSTEVATARLTTTSCQQVAYECRDYSSFTLGECGRCDEANNQCYLMGFDYQYADIGELPLRTSHPGKKLYITTGNVEPFCLQHYQVLIKFEPGPELAQQAKRNKWRIQMESLDENNKRFSDITITNQMAPNVFSYLYLTETHPTRVKSVRIQIRQSDGKLVQMQQYLSSSGAPNNNNNNNNNNNPNSNALYQLPFKVFNVEFNFMSNINAKIRQTMSSRLCPVGSNPSWFKQPPQSAEFAANSIDTQGDSWIYFEPCPLTQAPVFAIMHSIPMQQQQQQVQLAGPHLVEAPTTYSN